MRDQRTGGATPPPPGSREHLVQRAVLLELLLAPPPGYDDIASLAARLVLDDQEVGRGLAALTAAGLATSDGRLACVTAAAAYFEALYPACP